MHIIKKAQTIPHMLILPHLTPVNPAQFPAPNHNQINQQPKALHPKQETLQIHALIPLAINPRNNHQRVISL